MWAAVPELAMSVPCRPLFRSICSIKFNSIELGYPPDAIEKKVVNLVEGQNFTPAFLKIVSAFMCLF